MLLEIRNGTVRQNGSVILSGFSFFIQGNEKAAIVGRNGSGKTTLLEVLSGEKSLDPDEKHPGSGLFRARAFSTVILHQTAVSDPDISVAEGIKKAWQHGQRAASCRMELSEFELEFDKSFTKFGFSQEDKQKYFRNFSGGEQTKIMLILVFLVHPDVLLLDEPTNYLDLDTMDWLENAVRSYKGAVIYVSHDRYFIDRTADVVWEIQTGKTKRYPGNYTHYRTEKKVLTEKQKRAWEAQQKEISRLDTLIEKFRQRPRKAAFARSRKKILERMEKVEKPDDEGLIAVRKITPDHPGSKLVLDTDRLLIGYDVPLREVSFRLRRGQKTGITGPNGSGKSTFLKTVAGLLPPYEGKVVTASSDPVPQDQDNRPRTLRFGKNIVPAYLDQFSSGLQSDDTVRAWFSRCYPELTVPEVHAFLSGFLFRGEDFGKKVSSLSGGEKARLMLASILYQKPNLLLLDEPTSHMDIPSREAIEAILEQYEGTVLFVSHDRYFLKKIADSLLIFEPGQSDVRYFPYGYDTWIRLRSQHIEGKGSLKAIRSAEEERMLEEFRSVPEKERLPRTISDTAASFDWEFHFDKDARKKAEQEFQTADEISRQMPKTEEEWDEWDVLCRERQADAEQAADKWTEYLIKWYDIWQDTPEGSEI